MFREITLDSESLTEYIPAIVTTTQRTRRVQPHSSLAAWRRAQGWSQREAAGYLGVSQSYYSKLESHDQAPRPKQAKRLMDATGVPLDELMGIAS